MKEDNVCIKDAPEQYQPGKASNSPKKNYVSRMMVVVAIIFFVFLVVILALQSLDEYQKKTNPYYINHAFFGFRLGELLDSKNYWFRLPRGYKLSSRTPPPLQGHESMFVISETPYNYINEIKILTYWHMVYTIIVHVDSSHNFSVSSITKAIEKKHKINSKENFEDGVNKVVIDIDGKMIQMLIIDNQKVTSRKPLYYGGYTIIVIHEELQKQIEKEDDAQKQRQIDQNQKSVEHFFDQNL